MPSAYFPNRSGCSQRTIHSSICSILPSPEFLVVVKATKSQGRRTLSREFVQIFFKRHQFIRYTFPAFNHVLVASRKNNCRKQLAIQVYKHDCQFGGLKKSYSFIFLYKAQVGTLKLRDREIEKVVNGTGVIIMHY